MGHEKLELAPKWVSVLSLCWYLSLWVRGVRCALAIPWLSSGDDAGADELLGAEVKAAVLQMAALYGLESALALVGGRSTLAGWRAIDFQLHHLPYAAVVGAAWLAGVPIFSAYRRTLPLTLLTSSNEAITIGFALGLKRTFDLPNRAYLLLLMAVLIVVETVESVQALVDPGSGGRGLRCVALVQLGAPLYHAFGVIPTCWRKLTSREALLSGSFASSDKDAAGRKDGGAAVGHKSGTKLQ